VKPSGVPAEVFPELHHGAPGIALKTKREPGVVQGHGEALGRIGSRRRRTAAQQGLAIAEHPRVAKGAPADHGAGTPGVLPQAQDISGGLEIAIADDRDVERLDHAGDLIPVRLSGKHLGAGPSVQREGLGAGVLHPERDRHRIPAIVAPPAAGFYCHRQVSGSDHCPNDSVHQVHVPEATRPPISLHHLLHRAAEVDVDELGLVVLGDETARLRHRIRIGTVNLDSDRPFNRFELGTFQGRLNAAPNRLGRQKLGQHEIRAHSPADLAKRRLRHSRHRSKDEGEWMG